MRPPAPFRAKQKSLRPSAHTPRPAAPQPREQQQFLNHADISMTPEPDYPLLSTERTLFDQLLSPPDLATLTDRENDIPQQAEFSPPDCPPPPEPHLFQGVVPHKNQPQFPCFVPPGAGPHISYPVQWPQWYPWSAYDAKHSRGPSIRPWARSAPLYPAPSRATEPPLEEVGYKPFPESSDHNSLSAHFMQTLP